jgi:hypothetical protein
MNAISVHQEVKSDPNFMKMADMVAFKKKIEDARKTLLEVGWVGIDLTIFRKQPSG